MSTMASQITIITIAYSTVYSRHKSKKTSRLRVTGLCAGNSPVTSGFPTQRASNTENVFIWWRHHVIESLNHYFRVPNIHPKGYFFFRKPHAFMFIFCQSYIYTAWVLASWYNLTDIPYTVCWWFCGKNENVKHIIVPRPEHSWSEYKYVEALKASTIQFNWISKRFIVQHYSNMDTFI